MTKIKCIYSKVKHLTEGKEYLLLEKFKNRVIVINDIGKRSSIKISGGDVKVYFDFSKSTPSTELSITDVVQQRELLVAFHKYLIDDFTHEHTEWLSREGIVNEFLKSLQ